MSLGKYSKILGQSTIEIPTGIAGLRLVSFDIDHLGKSNHKMSLKFEVLKTNPSNQVDDIRCYILNREQYVEWTLSCIRTGTTSLAPTNCFYYSEQVASGQYSFHIVNGGSIYFIFDNRYSSFSSKKVVLRIDEEWEQQSRSIGLVTTIPPHDRSLETQAKAMICNCNHTLKIISPYLDMSFIKDILDKTKTVDIQVITRTKEEFTKDKGKAFSYIKDNLKGNHRVNESIHSRVMICDNEVALISSADLTQDSLVNQYNAGTVLMDPVIVTKLTQYFEEVWNHSTSTISTTK